MNIDTVFTAHLQWGILQSTFRAYSVPECLWPFVLSCPPRGPSQKQPVRTPHGLDHLSANTTLSGTQAMAEFDDLCPVEFSCPVEGKTLSGFRGPLRNGRHPLQLLLQSVTSMPSVRSEYSSHIGCPHRIVDRNSVDKSRAPVPGPAAAALPPRSAERNCYATIRFHCDRPSRSLRPAHNGSRSIEINARIMHNMAYSVPVIEAARVLRA